MALQAIAFPTGREVPETGNIVLATTQGKKVAVGRKASSGDGICLGAQQLAHRALPNANRAVVSTAYKRMAIGRKLNRGDGTDVSEISVHELGANPVPYGDRPVGCASKNVSSFWGKSDTPDAASLALKDLHRYSGGYVP